jgi:tetratricopeptide (TPR) repeat protein
MGRTGLGLLFLLGCFACLGCSREEKSQVRQAEALAAPDSDAADTSATDYDVSQEEAEAFAVAWAAGIVDNDVETIQSLFDWDGLCRRVAEPLELTADDHGQFVQGMKGRDPAGQLTRQIAENCQTGGSYRLVRVLRRDGRYHAVFRMILPNQGMNYHDIRIVRANGQIVGDRIFVAISGEEMADTMRALALPALQDRNLVGRLSGKQRAGEAAFDTTIALLKAVREGQFQEAVNLYDRLPEANRSNKSVMLAMINAQGELDETKYLESIDRYREAYPNDPSLGLILLDAAGLRKDWDLLEISRQKLTDWTGGDPYLDLMIAAILCQDPASIEKALRLAEKIDPSTVGLPQAHEYKFSVALSGKDFKTVVQQMIVLRDEYGVEFDETLIRAEPLFAEFVQSPEFADWLSQQE